MQVELSALMLAGLSRPGKYLLVPLYSHREGRFEG
jgi:hypothetical protein